METGNPHPFRWRVRPQECYLVDHSRPVPATCRLSHTTAITLAKLYLDVNLVSMIQMLLWLATMLVQIKQLPFTANLRELASVKIPKGVKRVENARR